MYIEYEKNKQNSSKGLILLLLFYSILFYSDLNYRINHVITLHKCKKNLPKASNHSTKYKNSIRKSKMEK